MVKRVPCHGVGDRAAHTVDKKQRRYEFRPTTLEDAQEKIERVLSSSLASDEERPQPFVNATHGLAYACGNHVLLATPCDPVCKTASETTSVFLCNACQKRRDATTVYRCSGTSEARRDRRHASAAAEVNADVNVAAQVRSFSRRLHLVATIQCLSPTCTSWIRAGVEYKQTYSDLCSHRPPYFGEGVPQG
jgi:hypothetical protein